MGSYRVTDSEEKPMHDQYVNLGLATESSRWVCCIHLPFDGDSTVLRMSRRPH
jgi:hypothetical protein